MGTIPHMAPEQTLSETGEIDVRTDVYVLGVLLYEAVTGRLPHEPGDAPALEVMRRIREEPPKPPSAVNRGIRADIRLMLCRKVPLPQPLGPMMAVMDRGKMPMVMFLTPTFAP